MTCTSTGSDFPALEARLGPIRDHHSHVSLYAALGSAVSLAEARSEAEALDLLAGLPGDRVSLAVGWHAGRYSFAPARLEALPPVVVANLSLHGFLLSRAAEERLAPVFPDIARQWPDPRWCEARLPEILVFFTRLAGVDGEKLARFMASLEAAGTDRLDDMLVPGDEFLDLLAASPFRDRIRGWASREVFEGLAPRNRARVEGVKIFTDGALGTRTAALSGGYRDGGRGLLVHTDAALRAEIRRAATLADRLSVHAIGDLALAQVLGALEALSAEGLALPRVRLEHAQFIDAPLAQAARRLGVTLCMQPNFNLDSTDYADRLSPEQCRANNPFRLLIDEVGFRPGRDLLFGSDGMPHGRGPALRAALAPPFPGQRLTLEEFAAGYDCRLDGGAAGSRRAPGAPAVPR